jgi:hypothetical protein
MPSAGGLQDAPAVPGALPADAPRDSAAGRDPAVEAGGVFHEVGEAGEGEEVGVMNYLAGVREIPGWAIALHFARKRAGETHAQRKGRILGLLPQAPKPNTTKNRDAWRRRAARRWLGSKEGS